MSHSISESESESVQSSSNSKAPGSKKEEKIEFKSLTEGLGFHPFSDGLPYAPLKRTPLGSSRQMASSTTHSQEGRVLNQGSGAVRAGAPSFVMPRSETPGLGKEVKKTHLPTTTSLGSSLSRNVPPYSAPRSAGPSFVSSPVASAPPFAASGSERMKDQSTQIAPGGASAYSRSEVPSPFSAERSFVPLFGSASSDSLNKGLPRQTASLVPSSSPQLAETELEEFWSPTFSYLVQRVFAFVLDGLVSGVFFVGLLSSLVSYRLITLEFLLSQEALVLLGGVFAIVSWMFIGIQEVLFGTSMGKRIFRLGFRAGPVRLWFRSILFLPSLVLLGVGIVWSLFDARKRCLHDKISGAQPIHLF